MTTVESAAGAAKASERRLCWAIFLCVFSSYMLSSSREIPWSDARLIYEVAESLVTRGELDVSVRWPASLPLGKDGKIYAAAPLLQSLVHVPGVTVARMLGKLFPGTAGWSRPFSAHVGPSALAAWACVFLFVICRRMGGSIGAALLASLTAAFTTMLWVYARYPYAEALQAACFMGLVYQLLRTRDAPTGRNGLFLGVAAGLLLAAKPVYAASIAGAAVYLLVYLRRRPRDLLRLVPPGIIGMLPSIALVIFYNYLRWGALGATGYTGSEDIPMFPERVAVGLWGIFLAPGKSAFLYSPALLLSAWGLPRFVRRRPGEALAILLTAGPTILVTAKLLFWAGDWAWGPRYLVFALPALLAPACLVFDDLRWQVVPLRRVLARAAVAVVLLWGVGVQFIGNAFYWDHWIRLSKQARDAWLNVPNRTGSWTGIDPEGCGACFEDMHPLQWLPPFQPIEGHWWLLKHVPFGDNWYEAEGDAPWRRYTTMRLNVADGYARARVDWWFLDYAKGHLAEGLAIMVLMLGGVAGSTAVLVREYRRLVDGR